MHYHGLADPLITPLGSIHYYEAMASAMGGVAAAQEFDRLYLIPGMGHCSGSGTVPGTRASAATVPLPGDTQLFAKLVDWVENGNAPDAIVLQSGDPLAPASQPICVYPQLARYTGPSPAPLTTVTNAVNYVCQ